MQTPGFVPKFDVLAIHRSQIERFGGLEGIRDEGLLDSALAQPQATFFGELLHPTTSSANGKYTGFADVPPGGSSNLNVKLLFQGRVIAKDNLNFSPGSSNTWEKNVPVTLGTINACTQPVQSVFGINTSLTSRAKNVPAGQATQVRVENMNYQIKFNRC